MKLISVVLLLSFSVAASDETDTVINYSSGQFGDRVNIILKPAIAIDRDKIEPKLRKITLVGQAFIVFRADDTTIVLGAATSKDIHDSAWKPKYLTDEVIKVLEKEKALKRYRFVRLNPHEH